MTHGHSISPASARHIRSIAMPNIAGRNTQARIAITSDMGHR